LVHDLANVFIFLPRQLDLLPMLMCTFLLCFGLCRLISIGGGPIQGVLCTKTNTSDVRSATAIDLLFGSCLLGCAWFTSFPLSTTWVFLGLLGGREVALRFQSQRSDLKFANQDGGHWSQAVSQAVGSDLLKASIALVVSVLIASGLQPFL
jgi:phosphate/sulfate permease